MLDLEARVRDRLANASHAEKFAGLVFLARMIESVDPDIIMPPRLPEQPQQQEAAQ